MRDPAGAAPCPRFPVAATRARGDGDRRWDRPRGEPRRWARLLAGSCCSESSSSDPPHPERRWGRAPVLLPGAGVQEHPCRSTAPRGSAPHRNRLSPVAPASCGFRRDKGTVPGAASLGNRNGANPSFTKCPCAGREADGGMHMGVCVRAAMAFPSACSGPSSQHLELCWFILSCLKLLCVHRVCGMNALAQWAMVAQDVELSPAALPRTPCMEQLGELLRDPSEPPIAGSGTLNVTGPTAGDLGWLCCAVGPWELPGSAHAGHLPWGFGGCDARCSASGLVSTSVSSYGLWRAERARLETDTGCTSPAGGRSG